jgi:hypothetical protein
MIESIKASTGHSVRLICETLEVLRSSYYHAGRPTPLQLADEEIGKAIGSIFHSHRGRYGYRRILEDLSARGITCAAGRMRRIMR